MSEKTNSACLGDILQELYATLPNAKHEVDWLCSHYLDIKKSEIPLHRRDKIADSVVIELKAAVGRRQMGEPLQYITGLQPFWDFELIVTPDVLIPRWDSETVVEQALNLIPNNLPYDVADICTGSGAYALAIKKSRPQSMVTACDISEPALAIARQNAAKYNLSVDFYQGDLCAALPQRQFDLIVSNPPYIKNGAPLPEDVMQEPHLALFGGENGLDFYRRLAEDTPNYLKKGGHLLLEIGCEQAQAVTLLLEAAGFCNICHGQDLAGLDRWVQAEMA